MRKIIFTVVALFCSVVFLYIVGVTIILANISSQFVVSYAAPYERDHTFLSPSYIANKYVKYSGNVFSGKMPDGLPLIELTFGAVDIVEDEGNANLVPEILEISTALLNRGHDINSYNNLGEPMLHIWIKFGSCTVVKYLLLNGANTANIVKGNESRFRGMNAIEVYEYAMNEAVEKNQADRIKELRCIGKVLEKHENEKNFQDTLD